MKKLVIMLLLSMFMVAGCGTGGQQKTGSNTGDKVDTNDEPTQETNEDSSTLTGYVLKVENDRMLVVSSESESFSETGGVDEFYNAIWFSNVPKDVKVGEVVNVTYSIVLTSYPGQSSAEKVEVIKNEQPSGATLTSAEAIEKALQNEQIDLQQFLYAIKDVQFDQATSTWTVTIKEVHADEKEYIIEINEI